MRAIVELSHIKADAALRVLRATNSPGRTGSHACMCVVYVVLEA